MLLSDINAENFPNQTHPQFRTMCHYLKQYFIEMNCIVIILPNELNQLFSEGKQFLRL